MGFKRIAAYFLLLFLWVSSASGFFGSALKDASEQFFPDDCQCLEIEAREDQHPCFCARHIIVVIGTFANNDPINNVDVLGLHAENFNVSDHRIVDGMPHILLEEWDAGWFGGKKNYISPRWVSAADEPILASLYYYVEGGAAKAYHWREARQRALAYSIGRRSDALQIFAGNPYKGLAHAAGADLHRFADNSDNSALIFASEFTGQFFDFAGSAAAGYEIIPNGSNEIAYYSSALIDEGYSFSGAFAQGVNYAFLNNFTPLGVTTQAATGFDAGNGTFLTFDQRLQQSAFALSAWAGTAAPLPSNYKPRGSFVDDVLSVPDGQIYSTAFETTLDSSVLGRSRSVHFNRANLALDDAIKADAGFAAQIDSLIPGIADDVSRVGGRQTPSGWIWHHHPSTGVMQLVPSLQHTPGSIFWNTLHPSGRGGYSIWAIPNGAPRN